MKQTENELLILLTKAAKLAESQKEDPRNDRDTEFYEDIEQKLFQIRWEIAGYKEDEEL